MSIEAFKEVVRKGMTDVDFRAKVLANPEKATAGMGLDSNDIAHIKAVVEVFKEIGGKPKF